MRGAWRVLVMVSLVSSSASGDVETVGETITGMGGTALVVVDVPRAERYEHRVGCLEPAEDGGWKLSVPWGIGPPCKPGAKAHPHVAAEIVDMECAPDHCVLPKPGHTFHASMVIAVQREPANELRRVQASVSVLRHEPPYLFVAIETRDTGDVSARGVIRVKLYKKVVDRVDRASWRPWRPWLPFWWSATEGDL